MKERKRAQIKKIKKQAGKEINQETKRNIGKTEFSCTKHVRIKRNKVILKRSERERGERETDP